MQLEEVPLTVSEPFDNSSHNTIDLLSTLFNIPRNSVISTPYDDK